MYCNHCGQALRSTARFCDGCGASVPQVSSIRQVDHVAPTLNAFPREFWGKAWRFESRITSFGTFFAKFFSLLFANPLIAKLLAQAIEAPYQRQQAYVENTFALSVGLFLLQYFVGHLRGYRITLRETAIAVLLLDGCLLLWAIVAT